MTRRNRIIIKNSFVQLNAYTSINFNEKEILFYEESIRFALTSMIFDQIYGKRIDLPRYIIFNFWILSELNVDLEILYSSVCEHI